jgi:hypothetical protein
MVLGMERFVIDTYGPDADAELEGFRWLLAKAAELGKGAAVVVPGVDNIGNLSRALGHHADYAKKNRELTIDGVPVQFFTPRTQPLTFDGPVLVPWADTRMVEEAERLRPPAICAIGWSEDGLDDWKRSWAPVDPRTGEADGQVEQAPPAVQGAVASLSGTFGNDVLHPMDKKRAVTAFKALSMRGVPIDPTLVRSLAINAGWEPDAADRLTDIARRIGDGRTVQGGDHLNQTQAKALVARFEAGGD